MTIEHLSRFIIQIPAFLLAITFHEAAHAFMAHRFGDDTSKRYGRLTLNPLAHLDVMGTVIMPIILGLMGGFMFGWAKPVPVDPRRFRDIRRGIFWVSFAGPLANIILAVFAAFMFAVVVAFTQTVAGFLPAVLKLIIHINIILAVFNLIPFPPLDGSKMVSAYLNYNAAVKYEGLARFLFPFCLLLMFTGALRYVMAPALSIGDMLVGFFYSLMV